MKVNMTPNPLDVVTIHASQGDTEARQWEFELHNNGELIDTSEITEQLFFKAYKGGTEQILPENTSTPTTSPFKGDIKYPQGLLSDQEFLYRESPTEKDGNAKIKNLYGNTLVWNQLVQNGNFESTSRWTVRNSATFSVANNTLTFTASANGSGVYTNVNMVQTHYYIYAFEYLSSEEIAFNMSGQSVKNYSASASWKRASEKIKWNATTGTWQYRLLSNASGNFSAIQIRNVVLFDLTQMGLDITDPSDFASLFPLPYYAYNQGSLLSFNGNGIKTIKKNLFDETVYQNLRSTYDYYDSGYYCRAIRLMPNTEYTISQRATTTSSVVLLLNKYSHVNETGFFDCRRAGGTKTYITDSSGYLYIGIYTNNSNAEANQRLAECKIQIEYGDTATEYESYTSHTTNLPISTYFPTGMKSAGSVYDELTPTKAITRIGAVDLGTLTWQYGGTLNYFYTTISDMKSGTKNALCDKYVNSMASSITQVGDKQFMAYENEFRIKDSAYTTTDAFKTAMSGVYLYYELATETETSFTTASLVTENAEIPLSNEDGVLIGKCTEQLSENPGFIDAKIKLADADGECYSNKIQLHVERSPQ